MIQRRLTQSNKHSVEEADEFYSPNAIVDLCENDELTSREEGFMRGYMTE